jgi:cell division protein FtsL
MKRKLDNLYVTLIVIILAVPFIWMYAFIATLDSDHEIRVLMTEVRQKNAEIGVYLLRSRSHIDNDFDQLAEA